MTTNSSPIPNLDAISCHAWNVDGTKIAVCPNNETILIYGNANHVDPNEWVLEHTLVEHDLLVSGIDWSHVTNKIVSCSHDRNAFVWTFFDGKWNPSLVILRINRAATDVKWSPNGMKFAVASGSKTVPVCHYEEGPNWWVSKMIKRHKSTVLNIAWHPNSQLLATGCADYKCRVFSAFIEEEVDKEFDGGPLAIENGMFGELLCEFDQSTGWVECCAWSPSGYRLAFVGHDATLNVVHFNPEDKTETPTIQSLKYHQLPFTCLTFLSEDLIVAAGHDYNPTVFKTEEGYWGFIGQVDRKTAAKKSDSSGFRNRMKMFENAVSKGESGGTKSPEVQTKHTALIMSLLRRGLEDTTTFSTAGLDGRVIKWDLKLVPELGI
jgi:actin related protein 2/3 complex subunit 1A/1B